MLLFMCHFVSLQNVLGPLLGIWFGPIGKIISPKYYKKSDNLQYNTVGRWVDGRIVLPFHGPIFILIFGETVGLGLRAYQTVNKE